MRDPDRGPLSVPEASTVAGHVLDQVQRAVVGKRESLTLVLAAILAILVIGYLRFFGRSEDQA